MMYFAHSEEGASKHKWQKLHEHLVDTAHLASVFADKFNAGVFGFAVGILHDIGKYTKEFQLRLEGAPIRVDHSTAGAQEVLKKDKKIGLLLAYVIAGHHGGLPDYGSKVDDSSLAARLAKNISDEYQKYEEEIGSMLPYFQSIKIPIQPPLKNLGFCVSFFIRMIFACLVDADFLNTERFLQFEKAALRENDFALEVFLEKFNASLETISNNAEDTKINRQRTRILECCRQKSLSSPGLFTLTVPTGGGKTLSSLAFALQHAIKHGMQRIIYVIPYTSIIEQNAAVFKSILGEDYVLEHHSDFQYPDEDSDGWTEVLYKLRLSSENWDIPIIVTTNVQFFESLFANKPSRCRKLHNIAKSVIILDEAQMLPTKFLTPCLFALFELVRNYGTSIVLCTATQPSLKSFIPAELSCIEIAPDPIKLYGDFKRVSVKVVGEHDDETLAEKILKEKQVLCIVNTRTHARKLFEKIIAEEAEGTYHLSALMCPVHRSTNLKRIKQALKDGELCRVVSTQLIEAGVDVDFPVVYRAAAGIDSIVQSAGRCNRDGRNETGEVYVFEPEKYGLPGGWFARTADVARIVMRNYQDPICLEAVEKYFSILYDLENERLDEKGIIKSLEENARNLAFPFRQVADNFKLIEQNTTPIIIIWDDKCRQLYEEVKMSQYPASYARKLQPYIVQVYPQEFAELIRMRAIKTIHGNYHFLLNGALYTDETGLRLQSSNEVLIF